MRLLEGLLLSGLGSLLLGGGSLMPAAGLPRVGHDLLAATEQLAGGLRVRAHGLVKILHVPGNLLQVLGNSRVLLRLSMRDDLADDVLMRLGQ